MPRIWLDYCQFLMNQFKITRTRRTFDRALQSLPLTQHKRIWPLYIEFARKHNIPETTVRIYRRYLKVHACTYMYHSILYMYSTFIYTVTPRKQWGIYCVFEVHWSFGWCSCQTSWDCEQSKWKKWRELICLQIYVCVYCLTFIHVLDYWYKLVFFTGKLCFQRRQIKVSAVAWIVWTNIQEPRQGDMFRLCTCI